MMESTTLALKAKTLLDAVDFDQHGRMVAGKLIGGNGGLISRKTIRAADELRKVLEGGSITTPQSAQEVEQ